MSPKDMMAEQEADLSRYFMGEGERNEIEN